jgi:lipopolysaccharide/colanic/teichoic acid biosynthesis glycosyltransferase
MCERVTAAILFTAVLPLLALSAILVWVFSRRSPLIAHRRVGWRGSDLWMVKLRTMWDRPVATGPEGTPVAGTHFRWIEYIDDESGPQRKQAGDPRVPNTFARFCRRYSIDELPQLWHVMRGEMALVGPRPVTAAELRRYYGADADEILEMKPGIAGLWQVSGRNRLTYAERRALDLQLVHRRSVRLYVEILLRTVPEVVSGNNAW